MISWKNIVWTIDIPIKRDTIFDFLKYSLPIDSPLEWQSSGFCDVIKYNKKGGTS
jgi:hypothetical protein